MHEMSKYPLNRCTGYLEHVLYWFISDKLAWGKVRELQTDPIHPYLSFGKYRYESLCFHWYPIIFQDVTCWDIVYSTRLPVCNTIIKVDLKIVEQI